MSLSAKALRRPLRTFHVWIGLILGLFLSFFTLCGAILVFRAEIERASMPAWQVKSRARPESPLDAAADEIRHRWPGAKVSRISFGSASNGRVEFQVRTVRRENLRVFADAKSGEIFGTFHLPWLELVSDLHHNLLFGPTGRKLAVVLGAALFLSSLSGLLIWSFRKPRLGDVLQIEWSGSRQRLTFDLHKAAGLVSYLVLLVVSSTGIWLSNPTPFRRLFMPDRGMKGAHETKRKKADRQPAEQVSLSVLTASAMAALPGGQVREIRLNGEPGNETVTIRIHLAGDLSLQGSNRVTLEAGSGRIRAVDRTASWPLGKVISEAITPVHYVEWGGLPLKALWALAGLMPTFLFCSGLWLWWKPYSRRRSRTHSTQPKKLLQQKSVLAARTNHGRAL